MKLTPLSGMEMSEVEHAADGLPLAWPIFRSGDNVVTRRDAMPVTLTLTGDDLRNIADYQRRKGAKIPIDCQHVVSNLAGKLGMDETDLLKQLPRYSGVAGFGNLEVRGDALYLSEVEFLPIGAEVMREGQFRYFSPSIRGLDGKSPLRVMSVALTNNPCLQNVADLAASEDDDDVTPETVREALEHIKSQKEAVMPEEEKNPPTPAATPEETPEAKAENALIAVLKEVLGDDVTPENLKVTLATLKTKAESAGELSEKVKKLECAEAGRAAREEAAARMRVIEKGYSRGVLTPAKLELPYIKSMTSMQLSDYCDSLDDGCAAPVKALELADYSRQRQPPAAAPVSTGNPVADAIKSAPLKEMR